jgi:Ribonuclease G/E
MRNVRLLVHQKNIATLEVRLHPEVGDYLNNVKRDGLLELQGRLGKRITIVSDPASQIDHATYRCLDDRGMEVHPEIAPSQTQAKGAPASR